MLQDKYIKKYNGVAVDLGSVIDTWADEFHSRKFLRNQEWEKKWKKTKLLRKVL